MYSSRNISKLLSNLLANSIWHARSICRCTINLYTSFFWMKINKRFVCKRKMYCVAFLWLHTTSVWIQPLSDHERISYLIEPIEKSKTKTTTKKEGKGREGEQGGNKNLFFLFRYWSFCYSNILTLVFIDILNILLIVYINNI
jgi:hypothetical protein